MLRTEIEKYNVVTEQLTGDPSYHRTTVYGPSGDPLKTVETHVFQMIDYRSVHQAEVDIVRNRIRLEREEELALAFFKIGWSRDYMEMSIPHTLEKLILGDFEFLAHDSGCWDIYMTIEGKRILRATGTATDDPKTAIYHRFKGILRGEP